MVDGDSKQRTAVDILLTLEKQIEHLTKIVQNQESLLKILLNNINSKKPVVATIESSSAIIQKKDPFVNKNNFENRPVSNEFSKAAAKFGLKIEDSKFEEIRTKENSSSVKKVSNEKKVSVSKLFVIGAQEKPLKLASIEIFSGDEIIHKSRTDSGGRMRASLSPGEYDVHITKVFTKNSGKKSVDDRFSIRVSPMDGPLELEKMSFNKDE